VIYLTLVPTLTLLTLLPPGQSRASWTATCA